MDNSRFINTFLDEGQGLLTEYFGDIGEVCLMNSYNARFEDENRFNSLKYILNDYSGATSINMAHGQIKRLAEYVNQFSHLNPELVVVWAMPDTLKFGLARTMKAYNDQSGWNTHVSRTIDDAKAYINQALDSDFPFTPDPKD